MVTKPCEELNPFFHISGNIDAATWALPAGAIFRLGRGRVRAMAFSPDGTYLAAATKIGLWWYELATMQPIALWETERGMVSTVSFSHNGQWIATGNDDGIVKVWDVRQGVCIAEMDRRTHARQLGVSRLAFSPDNRCLAVTGTHDAIVDIWNAESGTRLIQFYSASQIVSNSCGIIRPVAFSPDRRLLACLNPTDSISVWDLNADVCIATLTEYTGVAESLCFSPCGRYLAVGGHGGVQVWDTNTWEVYRTYADYDTSRVSLAYSHDGGLYATEISDNTASVGDVEQGEKRWTSVKKIGSFQCAQFSGDCQFVVVGAKEWTVWATGSSQSHKFPHSHTTFPDSVVFSPDGKTLAAGSWNDGVKVWNITYPSHPPIHFDLPGKNHCVSLSPDGTFLATGIDRNTVRIWNVGETTPRRTLALSEKDRVVCSAAFSPRSNLTACGDNKGNLHLWGGQHEGKRHILTAHQGAVDFVALSPDERHLVSMSVYDAQDSQLWNVESGETVDMFPNNIKKIAFSPCGHKIACGMQKEILLWDVNRHRTILTLPHAQQSWWPFALAFSPCGEYLASGAWWHRGMRIKKVAIRLWAVSTGENIATFRGHPTDVQCLAFSPDGMVLASGSYDNTFLLWNMKPYLQTNVSL